ncbi:MAG: flavin reductase family protein [Myxococcales bacterium]|jgi:flavin reductase ActVB
MTPDPQLYKDVLSRFASGVTVVTTHSDGKPHGLTVSAFCSVSLDPPRVLVCLDNGTDSLPRIERAGCFAVHILGEDHARLALRFAKMLPDVTDPFDGLSYTSGATGSPLLSRCLGWLDCTVDGAHVVGDHTVVFGAVQALAVGEPGKPVLYCDRAFRTLAAEPLMP